MANLVGHSGCNILAMSAELLCDEADDNKFHVRDGVVLKYAHAGVVRAAENKDSGVQNETCGELRDLMIT